MTAEYARKLLGYRKTIVRNGARFEGEVIGVIEFPAVMVETDTGLRIAVALDGAEVDDGS